MTGAALRLTWPHFLWQVQHLREMAGKNRKTKWYKAVSSALDFPFLKEVSENCFGFDVVTCEHYRGSKSFFVLDLSPSTLEGSLV